MPVSVLNFNRNSDQPLLIEVVFPHETASKTPIVVSRDFVESFQVEVTSRGSWKASLVLFDRTGDFILRLVSTTGFGRLVNLRWGWDDGRGIDVYPEYQGQWTTFQPEFTAEGTRITFEILPVEARDQAVDKIARRFPAGAQISEIVRFIADQREWLTTDDNGRDTIQVTRNARLTRPLIQDARETDFKFILKQLVPLAVADDKEGGPFYFYLDTYDVVHFHQERFLPDIERVLYRFGQDAMGSVIEFSPSDLRFVAALVGGGTTVFRGLDSLAGTRLRLASTDLGGLPNVRERVDKGGEFLTPLFSRAQAERPTSPISTVQYIVARSKADFEQQAQTRFAAWRRMAYPAVLTVRGTHGVVPLTIVRVEYLTSDQQTPHFLSGDFLVQTIEHEVGSSGWQTRFTLYRTGVAFTPSAQPIQNADKVQGAPVVAETPMTGADARTPLQGSKIAVAVQP